MSGWRAKGISAEGVTAFCAVVALIFVGWQSILLRNALETPFDANLQGEAIEICGDLRASLRNWSEVSLAVFAPLVDGDIADVLALVPDDGKRAERQKLGSDLFRSATSELRDRLSRGRYILADDGNLAEIERIVEAVESQLTIRSVFSRDEIDQFLDQQESGETSMKLILTPSELEKLNTSFLSAIEDLDKLCFSSTRIEVQ